MCVCHLSIDCGSTRKRAEPQTSSKQQSVRDYYWARYTQQRNTTTALYCLWRTKRLSKVVLSYGSLRNQREPYAGTPMNHTGGIGLEAAGGIRDWEL